MSTELPAAAAAARKRLLAEIRQLATDHGAVYFAEVRPCRCKPGCHVKLSPKIPFDDLLARLEEM